MWMIFTKRENGLLNYYTSSAIKVSLSFTLYLSIVYGRNRLREKKNSDVKTKCWSKPIVRHMPGVRGVSVFNTFSKGKINCQAPVQGFFLQDFKIVDHERKASRFNIGCLKY